MLASVLDFGFFYVVQGLVLGLLIFLLARGQWRRLPGVLGYLCALLLLDGVSRRYVFYHFGVNSLQYYYFYWLTDVALTLGAFLLVCTFFHRACADQARIWRHLRLMLVFVFIMVLGISAFSLSRNYGNLFSVFMFEFQQNLYFTCLILNTLLYILMQQIQTDDNELDLLVCGMGLQFAGPAASLALKFLAPNNEITESIMHIVLPLCTLAMLLTWFYAVTRMPLTARAHASTELVPSRAAGRMVA